MREIDWSTAPEGTMFFSCDHFRKLVEGEEFRWINNKWSRTISNTLEEHETFSDFQMRSCLNIEWLREPAITSERMDEILSEAMDKANSVPVEGLEELMKSSPEQAWCGASYDLGQPVGVLVEPSGAIKSSIDFLDEVKSIQSQRAAEYEQDGGERSFAKVATVFNTYTGKNLEPSDVALLLEILKNVRFYSQDGYHSDSVIDKISYASLWAELVTEERT